PRSAALASVAASASGRRARGGPRRAARRGARADQGAAVHPAQSHRQDPDLAPTKDRLFCPSSSGIVIQPHLFSAGSLSALLAIALIDLVLAGDNALIIGLVARNLPRQRQRQVIFWGTFGAIAVRALMAVLVVHLLALPGFMLAGGLALVWIAHKLLSPDPEPAGGLAGHPPAPSFARPPRPTPLARALSGTRPVPAISRS